VTWITNPGDGGVGKDLTETTDVGKLLINRTGFAQSFWFI
jgi:hypothetical protein